VRETQRTRVESCTHTLTHTHTHIHTHTHTHIHTNTHGKNGLTKAYLLRNQKGSNPIIILTILTIFEWLLRTFSGNPAFRTAIFFTDEVGI
jgi:hypothetical protein